MTKWLDYMFNIWSFTTIGIAQKHKNLPKEVENVAKYYLALNKWSKIDKLPPKWRNFAESGHTDLCPLSQKISPCVCLCVSDKRLSL